MCVCVCPVALEHQVLERWSAEKKEADKRVGVLERYPRPPDMTLECFPHSHYLSNIIRALLKWICAPGGLYVGH